MNSRGGTATYGLKRAAGADRTRATWRKKGKAYFFLCHVQLVFHCCERESERERRQRRERTVARQEIQVGVAKREVRRPKGL